MARKFPLIITCLIIFVLLYWFTGDESAKKQTKSVKSDVFTKRCLKSIYSGNGQLCAFCLKMSSVEQLQLPKGRNIKLNVQHSQKVEENVKNSLLMINKPVNLQCEEYLQLVDQDALKSAETNLQKTDIVSFEDNSAVKEILTLLESRHEQSKDSADHRSSEYEIQESVKEIVVFQYSTSPSEEQAMSLSYQSEGSVSSSPNNGWLLQSEMSILKISIITYLVTIMVMRNCTDENPQNGRDTCGQILCIEECNSDATLGNKLVLFGIYFLQILRFYVDLSFIGSNSEFMICSTSSNFFLTICLLKNFKESSMQFIKATLIGIVYGGAILLQSQTLFTNSAFGSMNFELCFWLIFMIGYLIIYKRFIEQDNNLPHTEEINVYFIFVCCLKIFIGLDWKESPYADEIALLNHIVLIFCSYVFVFLVSEIPGGKVQKFEEFKHGKGISLRGYENQLYQMDGDD